VRGIRFGMGIGGGQWYLHPPVPLLAPIRFRRAADFTALRLGRAVLGYLGVVVAIITLAPFRFETAPVHGWSTVWSWSDLVLNVLMFTPIGFVYQLTRPRGTPTSWWRIVALGAGLSTSIELLQLFAPDRYTSLFDIATNTTGAVVGAAGFAIISQRVRGDTAIHTLALELPLMGLVYLLIPLCWLIGFGSDGELRRLLVLAPGLMAGGILGTVHAAYVQPSPPAWWLPVTTVGWALVAFVPGARGDLTVIVPGAVLVLAMAMLRDATIRRTLVAASAEHGTGANRRFELPTLRLVLPLYAAYLALSAVWPVAMDGLEWRGTLALMAPGVTPSTSMVFRALEQVAAFTLVGYMGAEYHGRGSAGVGAALPRIIGWSLVTSALLQIVRGFQSEAVASLSLFVLTQIAAAFGHVLYLLQRDHVQALVKRRTLLERFRRAHGETN